MCIGEKLTTLVQAVSVRDKAVADCEYESDWYCRNEIMDVEEAEKALEDHIKDMIDARISASQSSR